MHTVRSPSGGGRLVAAELRGGPRVDAGCAGAHPRPPLFRCALCLSAGCALLSAAGRWRHYLNTSGWRVWRRRRRVDGGIGWRWRCHARLAAQCCQGRPRSQPAAALADALDVAHFIGTHCVSEENRPGLRSSLTQRVPIAGEMPASAPSKLTPRVLNHLSPRPGRRMS